MRHLIDTPISENGVFIYCFIFFMSIYTGNLFIAVFLYSEDTYISVFIVVGLSLLFSTVCFSFNIYVKYSQVEILVDKTYSISTRPLFFVIFKYKLSIDNPKTTLFDLYFLTKKAVIKYCLELEKKKLKEGNINSISNVMRLTAML